MRPALLSHAFLPWLLIGCCWASSDSNVAWNNRVQGEGRGKESEAGGIRDKMAGMKHVMLSEFEGVKHHMDVLEDRMTRKLEESLCEKRLAGLESELVQMSDRMKLMELNLALKLDAIANATGGTSVATENARDCSEVQSQGNRKSGVYAVIIGGKQVQVYCDLETDRGGWTVFQRRDDVSPQEDFTRGWKEYQTGFGDLWKEFWLGLDNIHLLTISAHVRLRIDMEDFDGEKAYAEYDRFRIEGESDKYRLFLAGHTGRGGAGDSLAQYHSGMAFTTWDQDNDKKDNLNCGQTFSGAWWYRYCHVSNLNGLYLRGETERQDEGVTWDAWKGASYSLKKVEMKVRPKVW